MRFLLRPGWLAFVAVVLGFVVACYTLLAPWQFGREAQREAEEAAIAAASAIRPVPLEQLVGPDGVRRADEWRQVTLTGSYLPDGEALVRLRVVAGKPAMEVLTPFRTADGTVIVVDRGTVASADGAVVPGYPAAPSGMVTLQGRLRPDQQDPNARPPFRADGRLQVYAPNAAVLAEATDLPLVPGFVQLAAEQPGVLTPLPVEAPSGGAPFTNFSYALQWLSFGAIALFALAWFVRLEMLQRRGGRTRAEERTALRRALAGDDGDDDRS
ncbi:SURF1 family cytochrome oxidase biogenesis protein [Pseudonocardia sp.]|uniref:SURF1 family cytochrome oxidase biogenesis protein n=1 Tax=Pseudonocardia sp. TaxID=60912 RepID=UPI003D0CD0F8